VSEGTGTAYSLVGHVERLWRYPVKSMLGEACEALELDARGVVGDRLWAVHDPEGHPASGKRTQRFVPIEGLFGFHARREGELPIVRFPDGRELAADDPGVHAALSEVLGQPVTLSREGEVSHLDAGPVHLVTTASLDWLRQRLDPEGADERRFRPNLVADVPGQERVEADWIGAELRVGAEVRARVRKETQRCKMTGFAQDELAVDARPLETLVAETAACFGVYLEVLRGGTLRVGDSLTLVRGAS